MRQTLLLGLVLGMLAQTFSFTFGGTFKSAGSSSDHIRKVAGKTFKKGATFFGVRFKVAGNAAKKISNGIGNAASAIGSGAKKAGEKLGTLSKSVGDSIGPVFESLPSFMKDVMQRIGGWANNSKVEATLAHATFEAHPHPKLYSEIYPPYPKESIFQDSKSPATIPKIREYQPMTKEPLPLAEVQRNRKMKE
ncbi:unnamed protein product [Orchesella dallaii]|uniref:Uncharacterized protein n=1 Tax=Orchesella dallaii TaxID=48710 RepID=A0ABP1RD86_9HEXA